MIENAPTYLDEVNDPEQTYFDLEWVGGFSQPVLLTTGDQSPPFAHPIVATLAGAMPGVEVATFAGAGHVPHLTHPDAYVEVTSAFIHEHNPERAAKAVDEAMDPDAHKD